MTHIILYRDKDNSLVAVTKTCKKPNYKTYLANGFRVLAISDTKEKAQEMIHALRVNDIIERYVGASLPSEVKVSMQTELSQVAADMYNQIVK